jgi:1,2-diacylglycerol 3-alpha-glucosyltransferase
MKIAMFTDTYHPQFNGVVTSIDFFVNELRKKHEVHIFCPETPGFENKEKFVHTLKSIEFKRYPGYRIGLPTSLINFDFYDFDIIHLQTPATIGIVGLIIGKKNKIPIVGTFHTLIPEYSDYITKAKIAKRITKKALWKFIKYFYNSCDAVIAPSYAIKKELEKHGVRKNIYVIPTGISLNKIAKKVIKKSKIELRKKYSIPKNEKIIIHVGRISKEKNIELILRAVAKVDGVKLIITSDGPYKHHLKKIVNELKIQKKVLFTGFLPLEKLYEYYRLSDAFVMASKTETQGLVLLEAAMFKLPILTLDAPAVRGFVRENNLGIVCKEKEFPEAIKKVLKIKTIDNKKILEKYSPKKLTKDLIKVYNSVINKNPTKKSIIPIFLKRALTNKI